ncbi:MAG: Protein ApaG [Alphaproteobacteria bacterium MarineAlpha5_Bin9]|nr:MAG: Protein ApaG [Alphaproteobacteria bacterium MarineAlpha5_Bin9]|tara:strand:+ start:1545 stop:1937 length:393 start_codon:yes stop_codon:yes gene_type:complete
MYTKTTKNINITVNPFYLEDESSPNDQQYLWAYQVTINNLGSETVKLKNRFWEIINSNGITQEVSGKGVIGKQPIIKPGEKFEYTSGTPLNTPSGFMKGHYEMETSQGNKFDVLIPLFSLDSPFISKKIN